MIYTTSNPTLHDIVELYGEDYDGAMSDYPIWNEGEREWLNEMILDHFRYREIAQETPALFLYYLRRTMREMMPTVNPIFEALGKRPDIMAGYSTVDRTTSKGTDATDAKQLYSATPQTQLSGKENYATNLTENESSVTRESADESTHEGRNSSLGAMAAEWLAGVNNGLYIVYNGLEPLFQQIW